MKNLKFQLCSLASVLAISSVLVGCQTTGSPQKVAVSGNIEAEKYEVTPLPLMSPKAIRLGGFSGLTYEGLDPETGEWLFTTTTDRGPNGQQRTTKNGEVVRPFMDANFRVQWIRFGYQPETKKITLRERTLLKDQEGHELSGLPNFIGEGGDEIPIESSGRLLPADPMGLDTESIALDRDGSYWMTEEYRPSILHFTAAGRLLTRWTPLGSEPSMGLAILPKHFSKRRLNRGFEGVAIDNNLIYAFLQSGFKGEDGSTRILAVEKAAGAAQAEYLYPFEVTPTGWAKVDKISDAVSVGNGIFYVIEQNESTGVDAFRRIYRIDVRGATNILSLPAPEQTITSERFCQKERVTLDRENCVLPVRKEFVADLAELGMRDSDKAEGLTIIDPSTLAVVNDNDFGVEPTYLMIIHLPPTL